MNKRCLYAIGRLYHEHNARIYEGADASGKRGSGDWFVYPAREGIEMLTLSFADVNHLLSLGWVKRTDCQYWFDRGPTCFEHIRPADIEPRWKSLSDFIRNATPAEAEAVYTRVLARASAQQAELIAKVNEEAAKTPPSQLHGSEEKT